MSSYIDQYVELYNTSYADKPSAEGNGFCALMIVAGQRRKWDISYLEGSANKSFFLSQKIAASLPFFGFAS